MKTIETTAYRNRWFHDACLAPTHTKLSREDFAKTYAPELLRETRPNHAIEMKRNAAGVHYLRQSTKGALQGAMTRRQHILDAAYTEYSAACDYQLAMANP